MRQEVELITQEELERLRGYQGIERDFDAYEKLDAGALAMLCCLKDKSIDLFTRRYKAARDVIDQAARRVGIDPENTGFWLYTPDGAVDENGEQTSEIVRRMDDWISRSGEKAQLKRRIRELEEENRVLRTVLRG